MDLVLSDPLTWEMILKDKHLRKETGGAGVEREENWDQEGVFNFKS